MIFMNPARILYLFLLIHECLGRGWGGGGCGWRNQTIHVAVASVISLVENYKKKTNNHF